MRNLSLLGTMAIAFTTVMPIVAKVPTMPLQKVQYSYGSQMYPKPEFEMTFFVNEGLTYAIAFDYQSQQNLCYLIKQDHAMETLNEIIIEKKMYNYQSYYNNPNVLDGTHWSFFAKNYEEKDPKSYSYISSGGSNAGPKNDGLRTLRAQMQQLLEGAEYLYPCDEEGNEIPNVPLDARYGDEGELDYLYLIRNEYDNRMDVRFHDLDESPMFGQTFGVLRPHTQYITIEKRASRCFGGRALCLNGVPTICLIVDEGAIETIAVSDVLNGKYQTTRFSKNKGLKDVILSDGQLYGIDRFEHQVMIEWE